MPEKRIFTRQEAADYLGVSLNLFDKLISRRFHPVPHIRVGKRVLIPVNAFDEWIDAEADRTGVEV